MVKRGELHHVSREAKKCHFLKIYFSQVVVLGNSYETASVSSFIRGSSHEPPRSLYSLVVGHRSHRFAAPVQRELASVHVRLRPDSGGITGEVGDCEVAGTGSDRGAIYLQGCCYPVTGAGSTAIPLPVLTLWATDRSRLRIETLRQTQGKLYPTRFGGGF